MKVFDQLDACESYIKNIDVPDEIVLIVSGAYCKEIMLSIQNLPQLRSVYIYCMNEQQHKNWAIQFSKVKRGKHLIMTSSNNSLVKKRKRQPMSDS